MALPQAGPRVLGRVQWQGAPRPQRGALVRALALPGGAQVQQTAQLEPGRAEQGPEQLPEVVAEKVPEVLAWVRVVVPVPGEVQGAVLVEAAVPPWAGLPARPAEWSLQAALRPSCLPGAAAGPGSGCLRPERARRARAARPAVAFSEAETRTKPGQVKGVDRKGADERVRATDRIGDQHRAVALGAVQLSKAAFNQRPSLDRVGRFLWPSQRPRGRSNDQQQHTTQHVDSVHWRILDQIECK